ncbi:MAG: hypothetical protein D6690_06460 [Nitrospirae bacterium]|nr:MAG: hypothetical protein D6690_06460 [Nitrospirota bacterium]
MEHLASKKLGILLSTPPEHPNVQAVIRLCEEALAAGVEVYLYLIDEGVKNLPNAKLRNLTASGLKYFACAYGCQRHNVPTDGYGEDVTFCGLVVLSNIINGCDRFLAFN